MSELLLVIGFIVCAIQAIRAKRLLIAAVWLAGASALVAILLYLLGAQQVAVIELSVGAGLVTVLFVFAIGIAGEEAMDARALVPKPVAGAIVTVSLLLLAWFDLPLFGIKLPTVPPSGVPSFATALWKVRGLDVLVQVVLIFAGVLGSLGLLSDIKVRAEVPVRAPESNQSTISNQQWTPDAGPGAEISQEAHA